MKGGSAIDYELKYMFILLTSILKQKPVQIVKKKIDWQKLLRYAEYHDVITLFYYAVLGIEKELAGKREEDLYHKYKKELLLQSEYLVAQEAIIWQLEQQHIHALLLSGIARYDLYYKKELGHIDSLEFLVEAGSLRKIQALMDAMDYEKKEERGYQGILYVRTPGIRVRFLKEIPDAGRRVRKMLEQQPKGKPYVRGLTPEKQYIYNLTALMEHYLLGNITIRKILDFRLYKEKFSSMISEETVKEVLEKSRMTEWEQCLIGLGDLWFGKGVSAEESALVLALEEYVLNPGKVDLVLDKKLLPSNRKRLDFYERDREEEWRVKKKGWIFPSKDYMKQFFPVLKRAPFLIVFCWGIRGGRIFKKIAGQNIGKLEKTILEKFKRIKRDKGAKENEKDEVR